MEGKDDSFIIEKRNNAIFIKKDNHSFTIDQSSDNDIWFSSSQNEMKVELNYYTRCRSEWQTYVFFEYLIKTIVGRYVLNDAEDEYSILPKDFIDLKNKVITWHSDGGTDNILKFEYVDNGKIIITILKEEKSQKYHNNSVRIRTDGSNYETYYQEFLEFFKHLLILEQKLNKKNNIEQQEVNEDEKIKKLTLFKKSNNKKK